MTEGEKKRFPEGTYTSVRYSPRADMWLTVVAQRGQVLEAYGHAERSDAFAMAIEGAQFHDLECLVRRAV